MKVAVGFSGGVDSTVASALLLEAGHDVTAVMMSLGRPDEEQTLDEARAAAASLGIPLVTLDLASEWRTEVCDYIRSEYLAGRTPNPCVRCNETVKFSLLPEWCFEKLGSDRFATGHYARVECSNEVRLLRAVDKAKDQSYFLYRVERTILAKTMFPLGAMTKAEVRKYAYANHLTVADKGDSQDFCGGDVAAIVDRPDEEGEIVDLAGKVLGKHRGFWHYTVGMRKGLGIGGGTPYYVVRLDAAANRVIVGFREDAFVTELKLADTVGRIDFSLPVKVRSAGEPRLLKDGIAGVAPGQSAVFYEGEEIVGGGIIA